jgi:hypothetical protein
MSASNTHDPRVKTPIIQALGTEEGWVLKEGFVMLKGKVSHESVCTMLKGWFVGDPVLSVFIIVLYRPISMYVRHITYSTYIVKKG